MFKDSVTYLFWFTLLAVCFGLAVGCGEVTPLGGAAGGGEGGRAAELGQGGAAGDELDAAAADAPAPPSCIADTTPGLAVNGTCDGGRPTSSGRHAACTLNGAAFVGCVAGASAPVVCYAGCGDAGGGL